MFLLDEYTFVRGITSAAAAVAPKKALVLKDYDDNPGIFRAQLFPTAPKPAPQSVAAV